MLTGDVLVGQGQHHAVDPAAVPDAGWGTRLAAGLRPAAHALALAACRAACAVLPARMEAPRPDMVFGLTFPSPVGVAAGFDPLGRIGRRFGRLGFGFAEIGTVSLHGGNGRVSLPQAMLAAGRRDPGDAATLLGAVLGAGPGETPAEAAMGIAACARALAPLADYLSVSLCARGGRLGRPADEAIHLLCHVAESWLWHRPAHSPVLVKLPAGPHLMLLAEAAARLGYDGLVVEGADAAAITAVASFMPVVAVGGIRGRDDAHRALAAGASLVQVCRGLMMAGPVLAARL